MPQISPANVEAVGHLTNGLQVLRSLPGSRARDEVEFALQSALGMPLIATRGYAAAETGAAYAKAQGLCEKLGHLEKLLPILYGRWAYQIVGGQHLEARRLAERILIMADEGADSAMTLVGHRILGVSLVHLGELKAGAEQIEQALALYDAERHQSLAFLCGQDQRASGLAFLALGLWLSGLSDQASRTIEEAFGALAELNHVNTRGYVLIWGAATIAELQHDITKVGKLADEAISLSEEQGLGLWLAYGQVFSRLGPCAAGRAPG